VPTRYFAEASSINFQRSLKYGLQTVSVMGKFLLQKSGIANNKLFVRANQKEILQKDIASE
ncbi:hypothetical protein KKB28_07255, partial [bacterium]|nr:hypothetical protein [bacterium]